jgi:hypothetical protein
MSKNTNMSDTNDKSVVIKQTINNNNGASHYFDVVSCVYVYLDNAILNCFICGRMAW